MSPTASAFDDQRANELIIKNGKLTGNVREPILGKDAKLAALHQLAKLGLTPADAIAVGDGANDIPMLRGRRHGRRAPCQAESQEAVSLSINHGDLTALLYLQGYKPASEFSRSRRWELRPS